MRYVVFGGEGQPADGQGPGQGFRGHARGRDEAGSSTQEWGPVLFAEKLSVKSIVRPLSGGGGCVVMN